MKRNAVILDFETGGLNPFHHAVLEVAMCNLSDRADPVSWLVKEPKLTDDTVTDRSLELTGISMEDVHAYGFDVHDTVERICNYLDSCRSYSGWVEVWCHNLPFDMGFLNRLFTIAGRRIPDKTLFRCTYSRALTLQAQGLIPRNVKLNLSDLFRHLTGGEIQDAHRAAGDVMATRAVWFELQAMCDSVRDCSCE